MNGLYAVLPSEIVIDLVNDVLLRGSVDVVITSGGGPSPGEYIGPRGRIISTQVWASLNTLSRFGHYKMGDGKSPSNARNTILSLTQWILAPLWTIPQDKADDAGDPIFKELFKKVWVPTEDPDDSQNKEFEWPPKLDRVSIYWWRAVIKPHCIDQCYKLKETADFHSTDLLRLLYLFSDSVIIPPWVKLDVELALTWFKYWWDEPPAKNPANNQDQKEMTMWSENHQILFSQSQILAGAMFRNRNFPRSGTDTSGKIRNGQVHVNEGLPRVERWLDLRLRFGFGEWNSPVYYNEDFPPLFNLVDFCGIAGKTAMNDKERQAWNRIKVKAAMVLDILIFDLARFNCRGSFGVTAGRAYWDVKAYGWNQSVGNTIEVLFGTRVILQE